VRNARARARGLWHVSSGDFGQLSRRAECVRARAEESFALCPSRVLRRARSRALFGKRINFYFLDYLFSLSLLSCARGSETLSQAKRERERASARNMFVTNQCSSFAVVVKQKKTDRHRYHCSHPPPCHLPGSFARRPKRRRASRRRRTVLGRRRVGSHLELLLLLVGVGCLGSIWLVNLYIIY